MSPTPERIWADANPQGMRREDPGPLYLLYNFTIDGYQLKDQHTEFIESPDFSAFLTRHLRRGRRIEAIGLASQSGRNRSNLMLSARRAVAVKQCIVRQIVSLRHRGQFDRFDDAFLDRMIVSHAHGSGSLILRRPDDPLGVPVNEEGHGYALSRGVLIRASPAGRLNQDQIEIIGREYIKQKYRRLRLPTHFRFWDLWTPVNGALTELVPNPVIDFNPPPGRRRGRSTPDGRNWYAYQPGYRAMDVLVSPRNSYVLMRTQFRNLVYSTSEVHRTIFNLMNTAEAAKNHLQARERELYQWVQRSGVAGGGGSGREAILRYQRFRDAVFLSGDVCLLQYNEVRPIRFT